MCQLLFANTNKAQLNRVLLSIALQVNSIGNKDGTGFLAIGREKNVIWKVKESADTVANLGTEIRKYIQSNRPVIAHVRAASKGIAVEDKNAHPFSGKRFILAHNGRLFGKDEVVSYGAATDDSNDSSDSLNFLKALEATATANPEMDFVQLLDGTMENFKGKFALMIYDSRDDLFYIARGNTADLHISYIVSKKDGDDEGVRIGYAVNTKKASLQDSLNLFVQVAQSLSGGYIEYTEIEELKTNTVYQAGKTELTEIGTVRERTTAVPTVAPLRNFYRGNGGVDDDDTTSANLIVPIWKLSDRINEFMVDHFLNIYDIDALFLIFMGVAMADAEFEHIQQFVEHVIPRISSNKNYRKRIRAILESYGKIYPVAYQAVHGLKYPWMLNDVKTTEALILYLQSQKKAAG